MRDLRGKSTGGADKWLRLRVRLLGVFFFVCLCTVLGRAVNLQVFERGWLRDMAQDQYLREFEIPARRGDIFDRRNVPLAQSVEVESIWADPSMLPSVAQASRELGRALRLDPFDLGARLSKGKRFAWVKRQAKPDEVQAVKALGLPGIGFAKEPRRFYPQRELAAQVLGVAGIDGRGLDGLERFFDEELSGRALSLSGFRDARGRSLLTQGLSAQARQGASVRLTLDRHVQYLTEKALAKAVEDSKATAGVGVVLDPATGELLALANVPRFNPNTVADAPREVLRNRALADVFEPGSTIKPLVMAAALERGKVKAEDIFFCENGRWDLGRHTINDTHPYGWLSPARILQVSSNICIAKIAQLLGREALTEAFSQFGFGERAGFGMGEGRGVLPFPKAEVALATQSFGQGMSTTAVQLAAAFGALANGGRLMRPYLVSRVEDPDGTVLLENKPTQMRQVISAKVARQVVTMLELVVEKEGTAPKAKLPGYRVAGKTGTAQKVDPLAGGYSDKRIASFIGAVPAEAPRAVIFIVVDEPKTDTYGGLVAAPAFKEIAGGLMAYQGVPPSKSLPELEMPTPERSVVLAAVPRTQSSWVLADAFSRAVTERVGTGTVRVPDLIGEVARDAVGMLLTASLEPKVTGSGRVVAQAPAAGSVVEKGAQVTVKLASGLGVDR